MVSVLSYTTNAVFPLLLLTVIGVARRRTGFAEASFFKKCDALTFHVLIPAMLFYNIYSIKGLGDIRWDGVLYCFAALTVLILLSFLLLPLIRRRDQKGVLIQCAFRSNFAIIGVPVARALGGADSVAFAAVVSGFSIPIYNAVAVSLLTCYAGERKPGARSMLRAVIKNPLIRAVAAGLCVLVFRHFVPASSFFVENNLSFIINTLRFLSDAATPLALISLGAGFDFGAVRRLLPQISLGVTARLILSPLIGVGGALLCDAAGLTHIGAVGLPAVIALFATPVAVSSAVMVSEIGGDAQLARQLVVWTSTLSVLTLFVIIFFLRYFHFL